MTIGVVDRVSFCGNVSINTVEANTDLSRASRIFGKVESDERVKERVQVEGETDNLL